MTIGQLNGQYPEPLCQLEDSIFTGMLTRPRSRPRPEMSHEL